jgi:tetratricopeptide (TPR) repeat protein
MLAASEGTFSFSIAICNSPSLRDYLISKLREESPSIAVVEINKEVTDILDFTGRSITETNNTGIFIVGIENLLPSDQKDFKVLRVLNATRESWRPRFSCPVVFWLAEYAATLLSIQARDLWSWLSHSFEFISEQATASAGMMDRFSGDILSAGRLNVDEKRFRIAELEQRIIDAGDPPKEQLIKHVLIWLNELGYIYYSIGELDKAEQMQIKSLEIDEKLGRLEEMANDYGNWGLIYRKRGELDKAEQMFRKALEIAEKRGLQEIIAILYSNFGVIYKERGDLKKAKEYWEKARDLFKKIGMPHRVKQVEEWIDQMKNDK